MDCEFSDYFHWDLNWLQESSNSSDPSEMDTNPFSISILDGWNKPTTEWDEPTPEWNKPTSEWNKPTPEWNKQTPEWNEQPLEVFFLSLLSLPLNHSY